MSLRVRLTVLTSLIVMAASIVLGLVAYETASGIQYQSIDRALAGAIVDVRVKGLTANPRPVPADVYNPIAVAVINAVGATDILRPAGYGADPLPFPTMSSEDVSAARSGPVTIAGEPPYRVLATTRNGRRDTVVTATPLTGVDEDLDRLRSGILLAVAITTVLGAALAWLLVRRSLKPVNDMVDAAQAIAHGDTERRVPAASPGTEMGDLSNALNTMIGSLTTSLAEVRESEVRLRTFVSDASHEIRTPLTVIRGYSELLSHGDQPRSELEQRALSRLTDESLRLESLVTQLLTLERTASTDPGSFPPFDLAAVVEETFADFSALHSDRGITVQSQPVSIHGSEESWQQVVSNLTQNIARYTPEGSSVSVTLESEVEVVTLTVDDAGPGIPVASRDEMLQRFTRLDESRSTESGGAGLGLSIVRTVVESHRGTVVLTDSPLGGLRVRIRIPRRR
jgi:two-component system OmpR family sensor kinase